MARRPTTKIPWPLRLDECFCLVTALLLCLSEDVEGEENKAEA